MANTTKPTKSTTAASVTKALGSVLAERVADALSVDDTRSADDIAAEVLAAHTASATAGLDAQAMEAAAIYCGDYDGRFSPDDAGTIMVPKSAELAAMPAEHIAKRADDLIGAARKFRLASARLIEARDDFIAAAKDARVERAQAATMVAGYVGQTVTYWADHDSAESLPSGATLGAVMPALSRDDGSPDISAVSAWPLEGDRERLTELVVSETRDARLGVWRTHAKYPSSADPFRSRGSVDAAAKRAEAEAEESADA